jgi:hypothetical protein
MKSNKKKRVMKSISGAVRVWTHGCGTSCGCEGEDERENKQEGKEEGGEGRGRETEWGDEQE